MESDPGEYNCNAEYTPTQGGCNPNLTNEIDLEQQEKIKGDAIGNTMYSERFVIKTLLSLAENTWTDEIESDLCTLWDMTTEKDVVDFLLKNDFIKLSLTVIKQTEEIRLTEIMVGIVGNMCCYQEACIEIFASEYNIYLDLIKVMNTPLLIQVMRLFKSLLFCNSDYSQLIINETVLEQVNFILSSSQNSDLLLYSLQVLAETIDKKKTDVLTEIDFLYSVNESFKQLFKNINDDDSTIFLNHEYEKILNAYLKVLQNICLSLDDEQDIEKYNKVVEFLQNNLESTLNFLEIILSLCCEIDLFHSIPLNIEFYIYCSAQFILLLKAPFSFKILQLLLKIFHIILTEKIDLTEEVVLALINIICYEVNKANFENLKELLKLWSKEKIILLFKDNIIDKNICDDDFVCKFNKLCGF